MNLLHRLRELVEEGKNQIEELVEEDGNLNFVNKLDDTEIREMAEEFVDKYVTRIENIDKEIVGNQLHLVITIANNDKILMEEHVLRLILDDYYVYRNNEVDKELTEKLRSYLTERFEADYYKKVMFRK